MLQAHTFDELLRSAAAAFGSRTFLIDDEKLGQLTYKDVLRFSEGLERKLDDLHVPRGAYVATAFHNCGLAALMFLGVIASRRVLVPLNPISGKDELGYMLDLAQCGAIFFDPEHVRTSDFGDTKAIRISNHAEFLNECVCASPGLERQGASSAYEGFVGEVVFTSGSTGRPKGAVLSEQNLISNARALAEVYELSESDRFLTVCPLFHNSGQLFSTLACALVGASTVAIKSDVGMLHFWHYADKYQAHWSLGMVSFLALLNSRPNSSNNSTKMRGLLTGGSVINAALIRQFETRFDVPVRTVYGLTECASIAACEYLDPSPRSLGSSGRPLPICDVRIGADPDSLAISKDPASRQRGEIWIRGPTVFERYLSAPLLTEARRKGDWLRTGDLGYFDEHGNLFVVDRLDSMLIVGGENVYPAEIERLCMQLQGAMQIVLAGVEHPIWGHELVLVYKCSSDEIPALSAWHKIFVKELSAAKIPQRYVSIADIGMSDFPRKENGKLDRQAIAKLLKSVIQPLRQGDGAISEGVEPKGAR
ncbi:MAG: class I adenylate-forming enzyme family protein [Steroidobacteraceae bacterium]